MKFEPIPFIELDASKHFGPQLRFLRKQSGLTLRKLSPLLGWGNQNISSWENGSPKHFGSYHGALKYASFFNVQELRIVLKNSCPGQKINN